RVGRGASGSNATQEVAMYMTDPRAPRLPGPRSDHCKPNGEPPPPRPTSTPSGALRRVGTTALVAHRSARCLAVIASTRMAVGPTLIGRPRPARSGGSLWTRPMAAGTTGGVHTHAAALVVGVLEGVEHLLEVGRLDVDERVHVLDEHAADVLAADAAHAADVAQHPALVEAIGRTQVDEHLAPGAEPLHGGGALRTGTVVLAAHVHVQVERVAMLLDDPVERQAHEPVDEFLLAEAVELGAGLR